MKVIEQLQNRRNVKYNCCRDGPKVRTTGKGCPQGGKASPKLWLIGMNDLLENLESNEMK